MTVERIAIVGMACRYPDALTPEQLWQNALALRRAFRRIPDCRLSPSYRGDRFDHDLTYATHAGLLCDWEFDRQHFGIAGPLFRAVDQTHWLALETAAAALIDAGYPDGDGLDRDAVGVILGNSLTGEFSRAAMIRIRWPFLADAAATALDNAAVPHALAVDTLSRLEALVKQPFPIPGEEMLSGALSNTIAGRICNHFDFHGAGYTVDGACASSLLAVVAACRALSARECDFVLAGGVDLSLDPFELVGFSRLGALATTEMRVYDRHPTGFLPGEGCGVVALMREADAHHLGVRSYASIIGWASSSDGAGGLTRPTRHGQVLALRRAYRAAGLQPGNIHFIEGHGTGTAVGDRVEMEALAEARANCEPAGLGTVKANIGHTKAAAGAAGLIKATLAVHHRTLPPTTGCTDPHELLQQQGASLRVVEETEPWPDTTPRAAVSSMGFGGINVHVVLEGSAGEGATAVPEVVQWWSSSVGGHEIVPIESDDAEDLARRLDEFAAFAATLSQAEVRDVASTLWRDRGGAPARFRCTLVARTPDELTDAARSAHQAIPGWDGRLVISWPHGYALGSCAHTPRIGLLFPGQAAPVRTRLPWWARGLDVPPMPPQLRDRAPTVDTVVAQPAIVMQSLAGLAWLHALQTTAVAAVGHSLGEVTALHWAGAMSSRTACELAGVRGELMAEYGTATTTMASLQASLQVVTEFLRGTTVVVAAHNTPTQVVVAGPHHEVDQVIQHANRSGVRATRLDVSHGFHSPAMRDAQAPIRRALRAFEFGKTHRPVISTVTGAPLDVTVNGLRELLVNQLTMPVRFSDALAVIGDRCDLLVEVGPGTILGNLAEAAGVGAPTVSMDCGGDPRRHAFVTAVLAAALAADLDPWFARRPYRRLATDKPRKFLTNPCENRSGWAAASGSVPAVPAPDNATDDAVSISEGPLAAVMQHLSATLELPRHTIAPQSALLADLHLNSLQVVQTISQIARSLRKRAPSAEVLAGEATVADLADLLAHSPDGDAEADLPVVGAARWVRHFVTDWRPFECDSGAAIRWMVDAPAGSWLDGLTAPMEGTDGLAIGLDATRGADDIARLLRKLAETRPPHVLIVHDRHPAAAALGRAAAIEIDGCEVTVVDVPAMSYRLDTALLSRAGRRYRELRADAGSLEQANVRLLKPGTGGAPLLGPGDVCLVTGGVRGITAYAAAALAERTECTLILVGRTAADDPQVVAALHDIQSRVDARYISCDVADPADVRELVVSARHLGRIGGLLHGAGINEPRALADVTPESLNQTLRPKVDGLRAMLDAVGAELRLAVGFGSIIGRCGLPGQSEYCIANDWLRVELERWAAAHPTCRTHVVEWSLWSGIGMGVHLNVLDDLRRSGVEPITPQEGADALLALLDEPNAPVTVAVTSRVPDVATIVRESKPAPLLRFLERHCIHVPEVETVVEAKLSPGSDLYLDDHRVDGVAVLPAVIGMEAMAQAAALVGTIDRPWSMSELAFRSPIVADGPEGRTIRIAALSDGGATDVVVRDDTDLFRSDRFCARIQKAELVPKPRCDLQPHPGDRLSPHPYYGKLLFHGPRFQRLVDYSMVSAFRVDAWIQADPDAAWFSDIHSPDLLIGDPGAHDATLHVLQACVPHRRALPIAAERVVLCRKPSGLLRVIARERHHDASEYEFDVDVVSPDGALVVRWEGLRLQAVSELTWPDGMPLDLVGPWLTRRLIETQCVDSVELVSGMNDPGDETEGVARSIRSLRHSGKFASESRSDGRLLIALADSAAAVEWDVVSDGAPPGQRASMSDTDRQLAALLSDKVGEDLSLCVARVQCARTALFKLTHRTRRQRLALDYVTEDGLASVRVGKASVITATMRILGAGRLAVMALAAGRKT